MEFQPSQENVKEYDKKIGDSYIITASWSVIPGMKKIGRTTGDKAAHKSLREFWTD